MYERSFWTMLVGILVDSFCRWVPCNTFSNASTKKMMPLFLFLSNASTKKSFFFLTVYQIISVSTINNKIWQIEPYWIYCDVFNWQSLTKLTVPIQDIIVPPLLRFTKKMIVIVLDQLSVILRAIVRIESKYDRIWLSRQNFEIFGAIEIWLFCSYLRFFYNLLPIPPFSTIQRFWPF